MNGLVLSLFGVFSHIKSNYRRNSNLDKIKHFYYSHYYIYLALLPYLSQPYKELIISYIQCVVHWPSFFSS